MLRPALRIAGLSALLLCWQPTLVWGQDSAPPADVTALERSLRQVAVQAIPRTVLIKAHTADGQMGAGSGALISSDGFILTCSHVAEIGEQIEVVTADGKHLQAHKLGRNKRQDYALLKVDATDLPYFEMGDSTTVAPGQWVVALGHPGGPYPDEQPSFAAGKVRSLHRKLPVGMMEKYYNDAIMTDCPIFAGDSGGPLVDLTGKLVGINGAIVMINEMAFAIPMAEILPDLAALKAGQVIDGVAAGPDAFKDMQDIVSPEDYQKMMSRAFRNLPKLFGGEDSPLGKLFGGGGNGEAPDLSKLFGPDSPFKDLFGGNGNGEAPDLGKLFGPDSPLKDLFGGGNGEAPDLGKLFGPDSPLKDLFGGGNGEAPDLGKLFGPDSPLKDLFGGGNGEPPDLSKLFGGGQQPDAPPAAPTRPQGFLGVRAAEGQSNVQGVLVDQVVEGGPAALAGVQRGDVVLAVDGRPTPTMDALKSNLSGKAPGTRIQLTVERATFVDTVLVTQRLSIDATLGAR